MSWEDMIVNVTIDPAALAEVFASTFRVDPALVRIFDAGIEDWWEGSERYKIMVAVRQVRGDFMTSLQINLMDSALFPGDALATIGSLCETLGCEAVTICENKSLNPYEWTLVRGVNEYYVIQMDGDMLDADDIGFRIAKISGRMS